MSAGDVGIAAEKMSEVRRQLGQFCGFAVVMFEGIGDVWACAGIPEASSGGHLC